MFPATNTRGRLARALTACSAPTGESCVMVKPEYVSECRPTAPLLPFRPGGFGKPLWQLVNQDTRLALCARNSRSQHCAPSPTFVSWLEGPRIGYPGFPRTGINLTHLR